jgi:two-component system sensor histidine kinase PilS (NtrC family)
LEDAAAIAPAASPDADTLHRKLSWLTLFRLATITVLLGGTALTDFPWSGRLAEGPGPLYGLVLLTYVASLGFALALRARWRPRLIAHLQVAADVLMATAVVSLTGGSSSIFVFLYLIAIVNGSVLLFRRGAFTGAALALLAYLPLVWVQARPGGHGLIPFVHAGAFVATAALAGYLAEQLQRTGERLAAREGDLAAITALHEAIVQSVASGLVTIDRAGAVTFLNRAGEQITGISAEVVRGKPAGAWLDAFQPGESRGETDFVNARGERLRLGYTLFPLADASGGPLGKAVIFQDLTGLRAMEEAMKRSELLADLGKLAAGLAHELRNPLASMTGSIELLRGGLQLSAEDARLMDIVLREAARLEQLVSRFLAFSRPEPPRPAAFDLAEAARETLEVFGHDPGAARVRFEPRLRLTMVWGDADQLRQVMWNLLGNAVQAVAAREDGGRVTVTCEPAGAGALLRVEDDGPGIAPEDLAQIFRPFFTRKPRGTGLGLALVQRIVDAHGGSIGVDSVPGRGAQFTVRLPAGPAARAALG